MKIFTKEGDFGNTNIYNGKMVSKSDIRIKFAGSIEELNASIGILVAKIEWGNIKEELISIQNDLVIIVDEILSNADSKNLDNLTINNKKIEILEEKIKSISIDYPLSTKRILPGGSEEGALAYWLSSITKRSEREAVSLLQIHKINPFIVPYLNRLSDLFLLFATKINRLKNIREIRHQIN